MAINAILIDSLTGRSLDCRVGFDGIHTLVTESRRCLDSQWQSGINDAAETIDIVTPRPNEALFVTDLIVSSSKKVASSTIILQLYDGTNTEKIMEIEGASSPVEFSHAFVGGLLGWKDAIFQVVTNQAAMYVVTLVGYIKVIESLAKSYKEWNGDR